MSQERHPFFVLGASDPEMRAIDRVLTAVRVRRVYALHNGRRVRTAEASRADPVMVPEWASEVVMAECRAPLTDEVGRPQAGLRRVICDHHQKGDPGYGEPAGRFERGSTLGQVLEYLGGLGRLTRLAPAGAPFSGAKLPADVRPGLVFLDGEWILVSRELDSGRLRGLNTDPRAVLGLAGIAAADHCLAAAYAGRCPGIVPALLFEQRLLERAGTPGYANDMATLKSQVEQAEAFLRANSGEAGFVDMRQGVVRCLDHGLQLAPRLSLGSRRGRCPECGRLSPWRVSMPMTAEAAAHVGIGYLVHAGGREIVSGLPEQSMRGLMKAARKRGMDVYGDPARGFLVQRLDQPVL